MTGLWASVEELDAPTSPNAPEALATASYLLWVATGRKWSGRHTAIEEYICDQGIPCCGGWYPSGQEIQLTHDHIARISWDPDLGQRPYQHFLFLRRRPVMKLLSVRRIESGAYLDLSTLNVYDHAFIAPDGSAACDPCWDPCGLEVAYEWGTPPPMAGKTAVLALANELVKSIECPDECKLPERITSVSRQGVNYQVFDAQDFLTDGRIGLYSVDIFLKAVNPHKARLPARVFTPDLPMGRARTWPTPTVGHHGDRRRR